MPSVHIHEGWRFELGVQSGRLEISLCVRRYITSAPWALRHC